MTNSKVQSYIGLACRAGAVLFGEDIITQKRKFAKVILISDQAPQKYTDRMTNKFEGKPLFVVEGLSEALHKDGVYAIAITNEGLAKAIIENLR